MIMNAINENEKIFLSLTKDEALVFFEWLIRFNENDENEFQHQSEERVLWDLEAVLEKSNLVILADDYNSELLAAREKIKDLAQDA